MIEPFRVVRYVPKENLWGIATIEFACTCTARWDGRDVVLQIPCFDHMFWEQEYEDENAVY